MTNSTKSVLAATAVCALLSACGGSGNTGLASVPPGLPLQPTQSASDPVEIFSNPATREFAALGSGDTLRIRYDAATSQYQVQAGSPVWDRLLDDPNQTPQSGYPNSNFVLASASGPNSSFFMTRVSYKYPDPEFRYHYSNLAAWGKSDGPVGGHVAFGMATAAGGVPVTGSGTYQGLIEGTSTVDSVDWDGNPTSVGGVGGSVTLRFDF